MKIYESIGNKKTDKVIYKSGHTDIASCLKDAVDREIDLTSAHLGGIKLTGLDLSDARLNSACFSYSTLIEVDFSRASMNDAQLAHATILRCNFTSSSLVRANFEGLNVPIPSKGPVDNDFTSADMSNVLANRCNFHRCNFHGAKVSDAYFAWCDLSDAKMTDIYFHQVDLSTCVLDTADFKGSQMDALQRMGLLYRQYLVDNPKEALKHLHHEDLSDIARRIIAGEPVCQFKPLDEVLQCT